MNGSVYDAFAIPHELFGLARLRRGLLALAKGRTLEICAGTGLNFKYYPPGVELIAVEPHDSMRQKAVRRAKRLPAAKVESAEAEALPYENDSFDTIVVTLGLCSVDHPQAALKEAHRVLKPGGTLLVMEHIRKNTKISGRVLDFLTPGWRRFSGGCYLNRSTDQMIAESGFRQKRHERLWCGYGGLWVLEKALPS